MEIKNFIEKLGKAIGSYDNLIQPISVTDVDGAKNLKIKQAIIEIKDLSFRYNTDMVLKNINFTINSGEKVGIVGLSGAGKTTLVNLIMRLYDPTNGAILIDGTDIRTITQKSLHENIGFIPQDSTMFNRTIRENIKYGKLNATDSEIKTAAKNASADKFILSTPNKYESFVGDRGIKLSGGQRQRIAIARAFLKNAPILILDEATSALDSETESVIQKSFAKLSKNKTTLVIAHRLSTLRNMDKLIVLDGGKIVETGTHSTLLRKNGVYAKLWKMQSGGFISE
jgi:ATP-binding cassette subfamily B protein